MKRSTKNWLPYLVYALLSFAILGPLLRIGYILSLDMVFTPHLSFTNNLYGLSENLWTVTTTPLFLLMQGASQIIPGWLVQKFILFLIFFLAGLGMHRLFPIKGIGAYFAGIFYMINPFTYTRLIAGQWGVLAAYALIPFAVRAFISLVEDGSLRKAIKVAILTTLVGIFAIHGLFFIFLAYFIIFVVKLLRERKQRSVMSRVGKYVGISALMFLGLNMYWLVPTFTATETALEQMGQQDILVFAPQATSSLGVTFDVASMHGFWRGGYLHIKDFVAYWWIFPIFIIFLTIYGFISRFKDKDTGWLVKSLTIIGVASFVLALGAGSKFTSPIFTWLFYHFPFFKGLRDSQKFVGLLCLCYAYLGGLGLNSLFHTMKAQRKEILRIGAWTLIFFALITPLYYSFPIFGTHGQLKTTDYPQEWYEVNHHLNEDKEDFNILFLPWHLYIDYSWLPNEDQRLACPASHFFDKPVIYGDNMEIGNIYSESTNPISQYIEFLLQKGDEIDNLGELLAPLNVKYVLLVHEVDYIHYNFLHQQKDLTVELEQEGLTLFRNEHPLARVYGVDSVVYITDWDEYLKLSKNQDVMGHLYIMGKGQDEIRSSEMEAVPVEKRSPVKYQIAGTEKGWTIFTVPQEVNTKHWEYDGKKSLDNLGFMPAFVTEEAEAEVVFTRFHRIYLPSYITSTVVLCLLTVGYWVPRCYKAKGKDKGYREETGDKHDIDELRDISMEQKEQT